MSDITINSNNISRFNKRLKKALSNYLNQDVPLHIASDLFAQALGVENVHELNQKLEKTDSINITDVYGIKAKKLLDEIVNYFSHNTSQFVAVSFTYLHVYKDFCINILGRSAKYDDQESFGLYFADNPNIYLEKELFHIQYSYEDKLFLENFCKKYFSEDRAENVFLGERIQMIIKEEMREDNDGNKHYYLFDKNLPTSIVNKIL